VGRKPLRARTGHYAVRELAELRDLEQRADAGLIPQDAGTGLDDAMAKVEAKRARMRRR
jgi:hypothetical protein